MIALLPTSFKTDCKNK